VAEANCARDRENKLSPVAADDSAAVRAATKGWRRGWGEEGVGWMDETDDLFRVRGPATSPPFFPQHR